MSIALHAVHDLKCFFAIDLYIPIIEVISLSSELARCLEDSLGVEVPENFLLEPDQQAFDLSQATPEQEQAAAECFRSAEGDPAP